MFGVGTLNRHAALMNRMAEVMGVDLTDAMAKSVLSGTEWRDAVVRCTGCSDPEGCLHWLSQQDAPEDHDGAATAGAAPGFCNNRLLMGRLRAELLAHAEQV
ncbi:DUF6455 family protein [Sedimentimonas flavescens]|uniref:DUF6455 family protein n=1 Tax=Sedimentimonas flavescens TaxID=2851012 RepID=UPI001C4A3654|nr:DUF6455 family protein [Sedimentimonas flavescens]MBW0156689.1 hypothetical protein [Sedimentimonas flavescens]